MPVEAHCASCNDVHPVGDRHRRGGTTACPACGSPSYTSASTDAITKPEADRIADAVRDVQGVGPENLAAIVAAFGHYPAFEAATQRDLEAVDGVGPTTAARIVEARDG